MKLVTEVSLHAAGVLVRISDERGNHGVGEASPLPGRSRETTADALAALQGLRLDAGPEDPHEDPHELLARVPPLVPSAAFAVETALLDLAGSRLGTPAWRLLGGHGRRVALNALVKDAEEAMSAARRGIRTVKAKLGAPLDEIHARVPDLAVRLDANGRLARDAALPSWLEYVEQPFPTLRGARLPVPIAADESVLEEPEVALETAEVLVLKPTLLGGWRATLAMAARARAAGRDVVVTHALEGPIARAACAALALALPVPPRACGLDAHPGLAAWPPVEVPWITGKAVEPYSRGGLGLGVAEAGARAEARS